MGQGGQVREHQAGVISPRLRHGARRHRRQAPRSALPIRTVARLGEGQKPRRTGGDEARGNDALSWSATGGNYMRVGQTNRGGCSIVSRHPVKAVGAQLLAFLIVAMAEAAPPAI